MGGDRLSRGEDRLRGASEDVGRGSEGAIVADSFAEGASVCEVARRHVLTPQQLFTWCRQTRKEAEARDDAGAPLFVPAVMQGPAPAPPAKSNGRAARQELESVPTIELELEVDGVTVRVGRDVQAKTITAVIRALTAAK